MMTVSMRWLFNWCSWWLCWWLCLCWCVDDLLCWWLCWCVDLTVQYQQSLRCRDILFLFPQQKCRGFGSVISLIYPSNWSLSCAKVSKWLHLTVLMCWWWLCWCVENDLDTAWQFKLKMTINWARLSPFSRANPKKNYWCRLTAVSV
jgi:hypothetical protein